MKRYTIVCVIILLFTVLFSAPALADSYSDMKIYCGKIPAVLRISDTEYRGKLLIHNSPNQTDFPALVDLPTGAQEVSFNVSGISSIEGFRTDAIKSGKLPGIECPEWLLKDRLMVFRISTRSGREFWAHTKTRLDFLASEGIKFDIGHQAGITYKLTMGELP